MQSSLNQVQTKPSASRKIETVELFGLEIVTNRAEKFCQILREYLEDDRVVIGKKGMKTKLLMTPNPEQIVLAEQNLEFKKALRAADWLIPDGIGLIKASKYFYRMKLRKKYCQERIPGSDTVAKIIDWANGDGGMGRTPRVQETRTGNEENFCGKKILVIGGFYDDLVIDDAEIKECGQCEENAEIPNLKWLRLLNGQLVGWNKGFDSAKYPTDTEKTEVEKLIRTWGPEVVMAALGAPEQEEWLVNNREMLTEAGVKLGMAVGGSLDFLTGKVSRAPQVMQRAGLEWLFRLAKQPWRWRRQMALIKFMNLMADEGNRELKEKNKKSI